MATMAISSDESESYEVDKIIDVRKRGRIVQYLVKWKGYESDEETWENEKHLEHAKDAIVEFNKKQKDVVKTPSRRRSTKQVETSTTQDRKGGKNVTQTTTITKVTRTMTGTQSESSSPESSPLMGRRAVQTHTVIKQSTNQSSSRSQNKAMCAWSPAKFLKCQWWQCCSVNLPTMIVLLCFLFIVLTFIVHPAK